MKLHSLYSTQQWGVKMYAIDTIQVHEHMQDFMNQVATLSYDTGLIIKVQWGLFDKLKGLPYEK